MSYAIIRTGGKQYRVNEGDNLQIEKIEGEPGQEITLDEVLAIGEGADLQIGKGSIEGAKVEAKIVRQGRGKKIRIWLFKRRKGYNRRLGHRQDFTEIRITGIPSGSAAPAADAAAQ